MSRTRLGLFVLITMIVSAGHAFAQQLEPPATAAELTLRPGDSITWSPVGIHRVRFGGKVTHDGKELVLTTWDNVQKVLDIAPPPLNVAGGIAKGNAGAQVKAKVKDNAAASGVPEFFFTCGFDPHMNEMVTVAFKIVAPDGKPARTVEIVTGDRTPTLPNRWLLKTPDGNKLLNRPKQQ